MLLVRDGQEDTIIHGNRAGEESGGVCSGDGDVPGITAQSGPSGFCGGWPPPPRLKRKPPRLPPGVFPTQKGIAGENLSITPLCASPRRAPNPIPRMGGGDRPKN